MQYFEEEEAWEYSESQIQKIKEDFRKMQRQFQIVGSRDYFETAMGKKLQLMIDQCRKQMNQHC
jgi:Ulp1 family protease